LEKSAAIEAEAAAKAKKEKADTSAEKAGDK
jgi:hypothetical protein